MKQKVTRFALTLLVMMLTTATAWATDKTLSGSENYTAQDGDVLTGSTSGTVTIANNAKITLSDVAITGGIVCAGTAEITLVGTNSVSNTWYSSAGIQIGSSGTTLTIKGNGSLNATGGSASAGIGLGRTWDANATGGSVVIEGGTVTASGGNGIGTGTVGNSMTAHMDGIIIKGGTVNARLGKGEIVGVATANIGAIKIYDTIEKVDASKITESVTYMHDDTDVTASASTYFTIIEDGDRRIITPKDNTDYTITIAGNTEHGTIACAATTAKYGEKITITATPDFGYRLSRLVVKDAQNNDVASTGNSFFMPKSNVTVSAVFEQGTHGTTEFAWGYYGSGGFVNEATIYDGVTTVNLQLKGKSYNILKYEGNTYSKFLLDNNTYDANIPYAGGTGEFYKFGNPTNFEFPYDGETGYYDITMTDTGNGKWGVSILPTVAQMDVVPDQTYTGSAITPEPLVIAGSLSLTKGTDYVYSYTNNTNVGTAKVRATFQGDYASLGYVEKTFNIVYPTVTPSQDGHGNYLIGTAAELYGFAQLVNNGNTSANAKLTADIVVNENVLDANGEANTGDFVQWTPMGNDYIEGKVYSGTFDGQGHTISGLYVSGNGWFVGFVGQVSGTAVVKNLGIVDSYFSSSNDNLGSIVGGVAEKSSVTIANVYSTSTVNGDNWIGGLVGGSGGGSVTLINCYFAGKTSASWEYGTHHDDLVSGDFDNRSTLTVCNAFVLGTSNHGTKVTTEQLSDGTVAAALHYYQDALADGSMFGLSGGKTNFSGTIDGVSVTTANITLHTFDGDATAYSSKYIVGNTTPLPVNVEREGYTFFGWYDNADLEGDAVTSISSSETGNKEYWAKFERSHAVSFVLGGGTIRSGEIDHYIEGETTVLPTYVTKVGASFEGWYTTEDFTGSRYYSIPSTATEDMTFYAKWGEEKTTFYLRQGPETVNILYEGENLVWLDETTTERYVISDNFYNYWGPIPGINVPYTGGASTFDHNISEISVAQSGFYVFTLTDKGEGNWFVSVLKSMLNCDVASIPTQVYTGSAIEPAVTVKDGETPLTLGTDYEVAYSNNVNAGTATVTITGKGNYAGSKEATFNITPFLADQFGAVFVYQDQNGKTALLDGTWEDGVDIPSNMNITVNHVTSNRMFTPGKASTVMLPFNYTCSGEEGGTFYKFVGVEKENNVWVATMQETGNDANNEGTLIANTPYLFMPTASTMTFPNIPNEGVVFCTEGGGNCETADPGSHWTFKGTYRYMHWKNDPEDVYYYYRSQEIGHIYGFAGVSKNDINVGDFVKVAWGAKIRPMRAYLLWNDMPNAANARSFTRGAAATDEELPSSIIVRLVGANGEVTNIGTLDTTTGEVSFDSEAWYTLDGVRLSGKPTKKGLYINNGKKIVIK